MQIPYELALGWRYTRAGRATRRNGFISFISGVSMLGIALGVAALIIVLSVMNGFQKEVRDRMLGVVSHIEIFAPGGAALPDMQRTLEEARANPNVIGAAPFVAVDDGWRLADFPRLAAAVGSPVVLPTERLGETAVVATEETRTTIQTAGLPACRVGRTQDDRPQAASTTQEEEG